MAKVGDVGASRNAGGTNRLRLRLELAMVLLAATAARLYGINFGLPYVVHSDEPTNYNVIIGMLNSGDPNPHFFNYPSFSLYAYLTLASAISLIGQAFGFYDSAQDIATIDVLAMGVGKIPNPWVFVAMRTLTAAVGVATVWLAYHCARNSGPPDKNRHTVGLVAAMLVAVSPTMVAHSRYITPDAWSAFFVLLGVWACLKVVNTGKWQYYAAAGAAAGLAAGSKYYGGLVGLALPVAHVARLWGIGVRSLRKLLLTPTLVGAGVLSVAVFLTVVPYAVSDVHAFLVGMLGEVIHYSQGHPGMEGNNFQYYLNFLSFTEGVPAMGAAAAIIYGVYRRSGSAAVLMAFPLVYLLLIMSLPVRNVRTILPVLPLFFLLTADLVVRVLTLTEDAVSKSVGRAPIAFVCVVLAWNPVFHTLQDAAALLSKKPVDVAAQWIEANLPPGSPVLIESYSPYINPERYSVFGVSSMSSDEAQELIQSRIEYVVFSEGTYGRYLREPEIYPEQARRYTRLFKTLTPVRDFTGNGNQIRIFRTQAATARSENPAAATSSHAVTTR